MTGKVKIIIDFKQQLRQFDMAPPFLQPILALFQFVLFCWVKGSALSTDRCRRLPSTLA